MLNIVTSRIKTPKVRSFIFSTFWEIALDEEIRTIVSRERKSRIIKI